MSTLLEIHDSLSYRVAFKREFLRLDVAKTLLDELTAVITQGPPQIYLDFSQVRLVDSAAIGALKTANVQRKDLILTGVNDSLLKVLKLTMVDHLFRIEE